MIHVHDIWKKYGSLEVLKGLTVDIFDGETLVILGRSGVGKSVLLKQIIGLETPDKGYVEVDGQIVTDLTLKRPVPALNQWGCCFKDRLYLIPWMWEKIPLFICVSIIPIYLRRKLKKGSKKPCKWSAFRNRKQTSFRAYQAG